MVQLLADYLKDSENVIIEIEDPDQATDAASKDIQTRRMNFYFKNGCTDTGLRVKCLGVPFRIIRLGQPLKDFLNCSSIILKKIQNIPL